MSNYMVSRREGYNIRMEMLADRLLALPTELLKMIYENVRLDHAATRIQAAFRRLSVENFIPWMRRSRALQTIRGRTYLTPTFKQRLQLMTQRQRDMLWTDRQRDMWNERIYALVRSRYTDAMSGWAFGH